MQFTKNKNFIKTLTKVLPKRSGSPTQKRSSSPAKTETLSKVSTKLSGNPTKPETLPKVSIKQNENSITFNQKIKYFKNQLYKTFYLVLWSMGKSLNFKTKHIKDLPQYKPKLPPFVLTRQTFAAYDNDTTDNISVIKNILNNLITSTLGTLNINPIALSCITTTLISIILQIVFLIRKNKNKVLISFSLIASIYSFIMQIVLSYFPDIKIEGFQEFIEDKLKNNDKNNKLIHDSQLMYNGTGCLRDQLRMSEPVKSNLWIGTTEETESLDTSQAFLKWTKEKCVTLTEFERIWDWFSYYNPRIIQNLKCIPEKPDFHADRYKLSSYLKQCTPIIKLYGKQTLITLWDLNTYETNLFNIIILRIDPASEDNTSKCHTSSDEESEEDEYLKTLKIKRANLLRAKELPEEQSEEEIPDRNWAEELKKEKLAKIQAAVAGSSKQTAVDQFKHYMSIFIGLICSTIVCILFFVKGKTVDLNTLSRNWAAVDFIQEKFSTIIEKLSTGHTEDNKAQRIQKQVDNYIDKLNDLLITPHYDYVKMPQLRLRLTNTLQEVSSFLKVPIDRKECDTRILTSLYLTANSFRLEVERVLQTQPTRIEPRLWLFSGPGSVGKSRTALKLAQILGEKHFPNIDPARRSTTITSNQKYFPPLTGEKIWIVDEIAANKDLNQDLIMSSLRGLCSPSRVVAETAAIEGKNQIVECAIMLGTTNTTTKSMLNRLADMSDVESIEPICSRIIWFDCVRNEAKYGKLNPSNRDNQSYDKSGNMEHVLYKLKELDPVTKTYKTKSTYNFHQVLDMISNRYIKLEKEYLERAAELSMQGAQKQSQSRNHFVLNLHGKPRTGKGVFCNNLLPDLKMLLQYPTKIFTVDDIEKPIKTLDKKHIVVLDDLFSVNPQNRSKAELWYMNLYNNILPSGSVIIIATNILPKPVFPKITTSLEDTGSSLLRYILPTNKIYPSLGIQLENQYHLELTEPGVLRRLGFTGNFHENATHSTDLSFYVNGDTYYLNKTNSLKINVIDLIIGLLLSCLFLNVTLLILFSLILALFIYFKLYCQYETKFDLTTGREYVFKRYQYFLTYYNELNIIEGKIPTHNYNLILKTEKFEYINNTTGYRLTKSTFSNRERYDNCQNCYKIYAEPSIAATLHSNAKRFLSFCPQPTHESITHFCKLIYKMFCDTGMDIDLLVDIGDVGKFSLIKNNLTCEPHYTNDRSFQHFQVIEDLDGFQCTYQYLGVLFEKNFSYERIANYLFRGEPLFDYTNTDFSEAQFITRYFTQGNILRNPKIQEEKKKINDEKTRILLTKTFFSGKDIVDFISQNTCAKILVGIATILLTIITIYSIKNWFTSSEEDSQTYCKHKRSIKIKGKRREHSDDEERKFRKNLNYSSSEEESEENTSILTNFFTKKQAKNVKNKVSEDSQYSLLQEKKIRIKGKCREVSDDEDRNLRKNFKQQSLGTLPAMNGYDECRNLLGTFQTKVAKNECWVINAEYPNDHKKYKDLQERNDHLLAHSRCYGLFVRDKTLITVDHAADKPVWVACKEFGPNIYKATVVKRFTKECRDFCILTLENNTQNKNIPKFVDITKNFMCRKNLKDSQCETILKRYTGSIEDKNNEQYLYGVMNCVEEPLSSFYADGEPFTISLFGQVSFASGKLALTTNGDCGLPYFNYTRDDNNTPKIHIAGIHCMGNIKNTISIGVASLVFQEDFCHISKQQENVCKWCLNNNIEISEPLPGKVIGEGHKIVWNNEHDTSLSAYVREVKYFFSQYPNFNGIIRKSSGLTSQGTIEHSHTHFVPDMTFDFTNIKFFEWKEVEHKKYGKCLTIVFKNQNINSLEKVLLTFDMIEDYVVYAKYARKTISAKKTIPAHFITEVIVTKHNLNLKQLNGILHPVYTKEISYANTNEYVYSGLEIFEQAISINNQPDIRFEPGNTITLLGALPYNASHNPKPMYDDMTTIINFESPVQKLPFTQDLAAIPPEQYCQMQINHITGEVDARVTQSMQWQGEKKGLSMQIRKIVEEEYFQHIKQNYSELRELTDHEVFYGLSGNEAQGLSGIDVNKSVGFTLSNLFYVTTKSDVLELNEAGKYSWRENDASKFLQDWYKESKQAIRKGKTVRTYYLDLTKMEKLKKEKNYLGRIFCNCDFNELLLQRKFLGTFLARSTLKDKAVGVGSNFWAIFNDMARNLKSKKNYFTGDYKRWDKTVPADLFEIMGKNLDKANPENPRFTQMFRQLYNSYHVSGYTVFQKHKGMPSGALVTANANSKLNELAIYCVFVQLLENSMDISWESFKEHVYLKIYGDDIILGVSDDIIEKFNMTTLRENLAKSFGFVLDSSEKDGQITKTMNWEELSWCSRYFRCLKNRNFYVGALKKATINSMIQFRKKNMDPSIYASTINLALFEASAWEEDYFNMIVRDVRKIQKVDFSLKNLITILTYEEYQDEMFEEGMIYSLFRQVSSILEEIEETSDTFVMIESGFEYKQIKQSLIEQKQNKQNKTRNLFNKNYYLESNKNITKQRLNLSKQKSQFEQENINKLNFINKQIKNIKENEMATSDYISCLNHLFQQQEISLPVYYERPTIHQEWRVELSFQIIDGNKEIRDVAVTTSKKMAKQLVAKFCYQKYLAHQIESSTKQMNSKTNKVTPTENEIENTAIEKAVEWSLTNLLRNLYKFIDASLFTQLQYAKQNDSAFTYLYVFEAHRKKFQKQSLLGRWVKVFNNSYYNSNDGLEAVPKTSAKKLLTYFLNKQNVHYEQDNIGIKIRTGLKYWINRLETFKDWPLSHPTSEQLAEEGFYYLGTGDKTQCHACNVIIYKWEEQDNVNEEHRKFSPHCPLLCYDVVDTLLGAEKQMDLSQGNIVPEAQVSGFDVSNTAGSMIFTNTQFAQGVTDLNPVAFSLNNAAQTGAPFDLRTSLYKIFRLESSTTVSAVQSVGSEVFRCSLAPEKRPLMTRNYIYNHESHIPSVCFAIYIGGAAGAIGTLKIGYVTDISKKFYTLEEIQNIASCEIALGQSSTVGYIIRDIRQYGLYRKVKDDKEAYPGIVALVSNPITNVQKNDTVQYPVQVYTKLHEDYLLLKPIPVNDIPENITTIPLNKYLQSTYDLVLNTNDVPNDFQQYRNYPDCGFTTGSFDPKFSVSNICNHSTIHFRGNQLTVYLANGQETYPQDIDMSTTSYSINALYFAYGKVPVFPTQNIGNNQLDLLQATIWNVQPFELEIGNQKFKVDRAYIFEEGIILRAAIIGHKVIEDGNLNFLEIYTETYPNLLTNKSKILQAFNTDFAVDENYAIHASGTDYVVVGMPLQTDPASVANNSLYGFVAKNAIAWEKTPLGDDDIKVNMSPVYTWTFVGTGNTIPTTQAPSGFSTMHFARPGSTLSTDITTIPPMAPGIQNTIKTLDLIRESLQTEWLIMGYANNPENVDFQLAYRNGVFLAKTSQRNLIKLAQSNSSYLLNIRGASSVNQITQFLGFGFIPYVSSASMTFIKEALSGSQRQMDYAAVGLGAGLTAFGNMLFSNNQSQAMLNAWKENNNLNRLLKERLAKDVSEQNFQRQLSTMGYGSASTQSGNATRPGLGFVKGETLNPAKTEIAPTKDLKQSDGGLITFDDEGSTKIGSLDFTNSKYKESFDNVMKEAKPDNVQNFAELNLNDEHSVINPLNQYNNSFKMSDLDNGALSPAFTNHMESRGMNVSSVASTSL